MSKVAKAISFTAQSHENHVSMKVKSVLRWLKSGHEVRVRIDGKADRQKAMENIYKTIAKDVSTSARLVQKVVKPESIKVVLIPTPEASNIEIEEEKQQNVESEISDIMKDKDIFSEDFEKELLESIKSERNRNKKKT